MTVTELRVRPARRIPLTRWQFNLLLGSIHQAVEVLDDPPPIPPDPLTPRQLEVLRAAAEGLSLEGTAERLFIEVATAKFHRAQIFRALSARTMSHAVAIGYQQGWLA